MQTRTSFERLRRWATRHYGLLTLIISVLLLFLGFYRDIKMQNQAVVLDYKMQMIEQKLVEYEGKTNNQIAFDAALQNDLREIKGYVRGISDKNIQLMLEKLPIKHTEKELKDLK